MKSRTYIVATAEVLRGQEQEADVIPGRVYCTRKYLRDCLRDVFDRRAESSPFLTAWHKPDQSGGTIFEGLKLDSWKTSPAGEVAGFTQMGLGPLSIPVAEIHQLTIHE